MAGRPETALPGINVAPPRRRQDEGDMPEDSTPRIGVVLEAFTGRPLDDVLGWLRRAAPEVTDIEVGAGGWLPYLENVYERQWERQIEPYWAGLAEFARAQNPELLVCLEIHPGTSAFNVETFERVAALGPSIAANLDPSHFFWMGMDGHKVAAHLGPLVGHAHGKDTVFHSGSLARGGLLDRRWPTPPEQMPWTFAVPGRGHDLAWWTGLVRAMARSSARVISIEHADPFVPAVEGVPEAARLLRAAIDASGEVAA
jgi:sugar phosphate isomerase/epimerase